jgi:hypothetical protein
MSNLGVVVTGKTPRELYEEAQRARSALQLDGLFRLAIDMEWLLQNLVCPRYEIELDVHSDSEPIVQGAHAGYDYQNRVLHIRSSVLRQTALEDPEAIFTVCHEIGHVVLHSNPLLYRSHYPEHIPKQLCDPEWQADVFAMEFAVDRSRLERYDTPRSAANYFRVPLRQMQLHFQRLRSEGVILNRKFDQEEILWEGVQDKFDF